MECQHACVAPCAVVMPVDLQCRRAPMCREKKEQLAGAAPRHMQLHAAETAGAAQVPEAATGASSWVWPWPLLPCGQQQVLRQLQLPQGARWLLSRQQLAIC